MSSRPIIWNPSASLGRGEVCSVFDLDLNGICLIDSSADTSNDHILSDEKELARSFEYDCIVDWNDRARLHRTNGCRSFYEGVEPVQPDLPVQPSCLFEFKAIRDELRSRQVAVFSTVGKVEPEHIAKFVAGSNNYFSHMSLVVCVVVGMLPNNLAVSLADEAEHDRELTSLASLNCTSINGKRPRASYLRYQVDKLKRQLPPLRPAHVALSVFAPLLTLKNVVVLHLNHRTLRILGASDAMREAVQAQLGITVPRDLDEHSWASLPKITVRQLKQLKITVNTQGPVPEGYVALPNGKALDLQSMLAMGSVPMSGELHHTLDTCLPAVILHARNSDVLAQLSICLEQQGSRANPHWQVEVMRAVALEHDQFYSSGQVLSLMSQRS